MCDDTTAVVPNKSMERLRDTNTIGSGLAHALKEKSGPAFPITVAANVRKPRVVFLLRTLECQTEIE